MNNNEFDTHLLFLAYVDTKADGERNFWKNAPEAVEYGMEDQILTKKTMAL